MPLLIGRELGGVAHEGVRVDSDFLCEEVARNLCAENRAALEDARVDAVGAVFVEIRHGHNAAHGRGAKKHCVVPGEFLYAGDIFVQLIRNGQRIFAEIVGEIVALVNAVVGVVGQLGVRGHAVCRVAVFVHLQIAEDAADSVDERVAESVIVLVYGETRYCRGETRGEAQIGGGVGSEKQTLVFCTPVKIQLRAAQGRDVDYGRRAAGAFFALCENGQARAEQQNCRENNAEGSQDVFTHSGPPLYFIFLSETLHKLSECFRYC